MAQLSPASSSSIPVWNLFVRFKERQRFATEAPSFFESRVQLQRSEEVSTPHLSPCAPPRIRMCFTIVKKKNCVRNPLGPRDGRCLGQLSEWNSNPAEKLWEKVVNFKVQYYDQKQSTASHILSFDSYCTDSNALAPFNS